MLKQTERERTNTVGDGGDSVGDRSGSVGDGVI